jgi:hypothetical protein
LTKCVRILFNIHCCIKFRKISKISQKFLNVNCKISEFDELEGVSKVRISLIALLYILKTFSSDDKELLLIINIKKYLILM